MIDGGVVPTFASAEPMPSISTRRQVAECFAMVCGVARTFSPVRVYNVFAVVDGYHTHVTIARWRTLTFIYSAIVIPNFDGMYLESSTKLV
jgi:hypothetical protein